MASLLAAGNALYGTDTAGYVSRYSGVPMSWTAIGGPFKQIAIQGIHLIGLTVDQLAVVRLQTDDQGQIQRWVQVAGPCDMVCLNEAYISGSKSGQVLLRLPDEPDTTHGTNLSHLRSEDSVVAPLPGKWLFLLYTKDEWLAGYDGEVVVRMYNGTWQQSLTIHNAHFVRNKLTVKLMDFRTTALDNLSLSTEDHTLPDHWTPSKVIAWCFASRTFYDFTIDTEIPDSGDNPGWLTFQPTLTKELPVPASIARIFIWPYLGLKSAVGHTSIQLSDETHISWWPATYDRKYLKFVDLTWSASSNRNQSYDDDVELEDSPPSYVYPIVGLDEAAVKTWWATFNVDINHWRAFDQNCSTIVYRALLHGGALNGLAPALLRELTHNAPWTPTDISRLAALLGVKDDANWQSVIWPT